MQPEGPTDNNFRSFSAPGANKAWNTRRRILGSEVISQEAAGAARTQARTRWDRIDGRRRRENMAGVNTVLAE